MKRVITTILLVMGYLLTGGCSLVLDTDVLQSGEADGDTQPTDSESDTTPEVGCDDDWECDDGHDCTSNQCGSNNQCVYLANNSLCGEYEYCSLSKGCTSTGEECSNNLDCDDSIPCTVDMCQLGNCRNTVDHSLCSNSVPFCRLEARCIPESGGCVEGDEIFCEQPETGICMAATCNEQTGNCDEHLSTGADNDTDSSLDADCGGDDCNDGDNEVYLGATEMCDGKDNDCDDMIDMSFVSASAATVAQAAAITSPKVAYSDSYFGVVYTDSTLQAALVNTAGTVFSFDLTTLATGTISRGAIVADPTTAGVFFVAWNATNTDNTNTLQVARLEMNAAGSAVEGTLEATLDHQTNRTVVDCEIAYDNARPDGGWVVAWSETDGSNGYVQLQAHDPMESFEVSTSAGSVSAVSLAITDAYEYIVTFAADYTATSGGDDEIYEARVQYDTAFSLSSAAALISQMDNDGVYDEDPSVQPVTVADGAGAAYSAYLNYSGFDQLKTIFLWDEAVQQRQDALITPISHEIRSINLVHDGSKLALLYIRESTTETRVILQQRVPTGTGSFDTAAEDDLFLVMTADGSTDYSELHASTASSGQLALAWIEEGATTSELKVSLLGTCSQ